MSKVYMKERRLVVPDCVTVPFIEGDGVGAEITPVCQQIVNKAVSFAYKGKRSIEWMEVFAGEKSYQKNGEWLPRNNESFSGIFNRNKRSFDNSGRRRNPIAECGFTPNVRFICLFAPGEMV